MSQISSLVQKHRILIVVGAGGVGKTTISTALASLGQSQGQRVALVSIDPAKRLATAMGLTLGNQMAKVPDLDPSGKGELWATMLDQTAIFDRLVRDFCESDAKAQEILNHPLYRSTADQLAGAVEYMALIRIAELAKDSRFDLIVVDTPPDAHAIDFLLKPATLQEFADRGIMPWLIKPFNLARRFGLGKMAGMAERVMGGASQVFGLTALEKLCELLVMMQDVIMGLSHTVAEVPVLLSTEESQLINVATPTRSSLRSSRELLRQAQQLKIPLGGLIVNRCLPAEVCREMASLQDPQSAQEVALARRFTEERRCIDQFEALICSRNGAGSCRTIAESDRDFTSMEAIASLGTLL